MAPERTQPSGEEVRRRLASLYDRAEDDTGNFNATRALAARSRRVERRSAARGPADPRPAAAEPAAADPAREDLMRQWFDGARSRLGPTVAAVLPASREPLPHPAPPRTARDAALPAELPAAQLGQGPRPVAELTAGPGAEPAPAPGAELTARPLLELTAAPASAPAAEAALTAPDTGGTPWPTPGPARPESGDPSSPRFRKDRARRQLVAAREMLSRHAARPDAALPVAYPAAESAPAALEAPSAGFAPWETGSLPAAPVAPVSADGFPWPAADTGRAPVQGAPEPGIPFEPWSTTVPWSDPAAAPYADPRPVWPAAAERPAPGAPWPAGPDAGFDTGGTAVLAAPPVTGYDTRAAEAVAFARAQLGRPCVRGASGPGSYDSPGLTRAAWRSAGVLLPRTIQDQSGIGPEIAPEAMLPGDLVFLHEDLSHVGLCTGDGVMVHAPSPGGRITEEPVQWTGPAAVHRVVRPV
ncbi:NlpC/P60 family protein [Streptomyces sp. NPDC048566]|uniref:C40 family peptidase n=1 Tax=Streptomyces sp. NPDC048566 TaxID=3365569 RepID=UPI003722025C